MTEVTTISGGQPQRIIRTTRVEPDVVGEHPQKVYEEKKAIFRYSQIIWYMLGFIEVLLLFRVTLKIMAANPYAAFTAFIYNISFPFVLPFQNIFGVSGNGSAFIEWSTVFAMFVYLCVAWGLVYFLDLIYPITPEDIQKNG